MEKLTDQELMDILLTVDGKGKKVKEEALQELISRKILTLSAE